MPNNEMPPVVRTYRLETIQDIVNVVTADNMETLVADLEAFVRLVAFTKGSSDKIDVKYFDWTDDGVVGGKAKITGPDGKMIVGLEINDNKGGANGK